MQTKNFWQRIFITTASDNLEDIRHGIISSILVVMGFVAWLTLWAALHYRQPGYFWATVILIAGVLGSANLRSSHVRGALYIINVTLIGTIVCFKLFFPHSLAQFYFPLVVIISGLFESNIIIFIVAVMVSVPCIIVARLLGANWWDVSEILTPNILIYLTAFTTWLISRQLVIVLNWMQTAYKEASSLLEQLRNERASMTRTVKQLEEAYLRIEKMNYALIEARSAAEAARESKVEFAANISHELRTPLNIIIGFSETMANAPETYQGVSWSPTLRGDVEEIYQSSRHLLSLIDDILDLSALDMQRLGLTFEETSIAAVITEAVTVVQDLFRAKQLYLKVDLSPGLPPVRIDAIRIRQVLINLLNNASRFTSTGGVTISAQMSGYAVQVAVADTGVGIAPQDISKVFDEFGQVDSTLRREHDGSGLGVPLSKRLIELHNGRMWLESEPGKGSTFFFTLPTQSGIWRSGELSKSSRGVVAPMGRKSVLIEEPDITLLHMVRRHLSYCDVIEIGNREDLQNLIEQHQPVALIVDLQDEEVSGRLSFQEFPAGLDLPVIFVRLRGQLRNARALGVRNFLIKPVIREHLFEAIENLGQVVQNILVVDDDPSLVELVSRMLEAAGGHYRPVKALGGAEALAILRRESIDLVLLDWYMPEVTGLAVLQEMMGTPGLADIPVIVISGRYPDTDPPKDGQNLILVRTGKSSVFETISYLDLLVENLPLRGVTDGESVQESTAAQADPPAS
ncbi:MAG TPA: hybrid sensor histidine kinase/response regulator [Anaerolineales bacterium]|nr:hybrid sensor histidine kinase/response regulator [Anaerolineales bacterium]